MDFKKKTWGFQLVFLPVPPPFASCHQVGIPGESFWASQMMGICHEMMGHPKRFLCKTEIVLPESPMMGHPKYLLVALLPYQPFCDKPHKKKELSLTQPVHNKPHLPAKHHIHVASWKPSKWLSTLRWAKLTLVISLDS